MLRAGRIGTVVAALFAAISSTPAHAQAEPPPVVKIIVGSVAGGILDPYARIVGEHMSKTLGPHHHRRQQAGRERHHRRAIRRRSAGRRRVDVGRHPGDDRDQSERLSQSALDHRRFHSDREGRRGAAGAGRPSERAGEKSHRADRLDQGQSRQARLCVVQSRARPRPFSAISSTSASGSISRISSTRARALRPTTWSGAMHCLASCSSAMPCRISRPANSFRSRSRARSARASFRTCRPSPNSAITTSPRWCGSVFWSKAGTPEPIVKAYIAAAEKAHADPDVKAKFDLQGMEAVGETGPAKLLAEIKTAIRTVAEDHRRDPVQAVD